MDSLGYKRLINVEPIYEKNVSQETMNTGKLKLIFRIMSGSERKKFIEYITLESLDIITEEKCYNQLINFFKDLDNLTILDISNIKFFMRTLNNNKICCEIELLTRRCGTRLIQPLLYFHNLDFETKHYILKVLGKYIKKIGEALNG